METVAYFQAVVQQERESDHLLQTSAKVTNAQIWYLLSSLRLPGWYFIEHIQHNSYSSWFCLHAGDASRPIYHIGVSVAKIIPRQIDR
jgi:predicted hotdog family 3-hydroxylacyl-ACP dehydratase